MLPSDSSNVAPKPEPIDEKGTDHILAFMRKLHVEDPLQREKIVSLSLKLLPKLGPLDDKSFQNALAFLEDYKHILEQCNNCSISLLDCRNTNLKYGVPYYLVLASRGHDVPPYCPILCRAGNLWIGDQGIWHYYGSCGADGRGDPIWAWIRDNGVRSGRKWPAHPLNAKRQLRLSGHANGKVLKWELRDTVCKRRREAKRRRESQRTREQAALAQGAA